MLLRNRPDNGESDSFSGGFAGAERRMFDYHNPLGCCSRVLIYISISISTGGGSPSINYSALNFRDTEPDSVEKIS